MGIFPSVNFFWNSFFVVLTQYLSYWLYFVLFHYLVLHLKAHLEYVIGEQDSVTIWI